MNETKPENKKKKDKYLASLLSIFAGLGIFGLGILTNNWYNNYSESLDSKITPKIWPIKRDIKQNKDIVAIADPLQDQDSKDLQDQKEILVTSEHDYADSPRNHLGLRTQSFTVPLSATLPPASPLLETNHPYAEPYRQHIGLREKSVEYRETTLVPDEKQEPAHKFVGYASKNNAQQRLRMSQTKTTKIIDHPNIANPQSSQASPPKQPTQNKEQAQSTQSTQKTKPQFRASPQTRSYEAQAPTVGSSTPYRGLRNQSFQHTLIFKTNLVPDRERPAHNISGKAQHEKPDKQTYHAAEIKGERNSPISSKEAVTQSSIRKNSKSKTVKENIPQYDPSQKAGGFYFNADPEVFSKALEGKVLSNNDSASTADNHPKSGLTTTVGGNLIYESSDGRKIGKNPHANNFYDLETGRFVKTTYSLSILVREDTNVSLAGESKLLETDYNRTPQPLIKLKF